MWDEIKDLIKSVPNISGDYDEKYTKIKFSSDDDLSLKKILKFYIICFSRRHKVLPTRFRR